MTQIGFNFLMPYQNQSYSNNSSFNFGNYSGSQTQSMSGLGNPLDALTSALDLINGNSMSSDPWGMDFGNTQSSFNNGNSFCQTPNMQNNQMGMMGMMLQMMQMFMMLMMQMFGMGQQNGNSFDSQLNNNNGGFTFPGSGSSSASASGPNAFAYAGPNGAYARAGNSSASASWNNSNNSNVAPYSPQGSTAFGRNLAQTAQNTANRMGSSGYCYRGVKNSLAKMGVNVTGGSAYMAANQLANSNKFQETNVPRSDLKNLPAGAVVVWDKCPGHPHGHISVALGNGKEASDHIQNQMQNYGPRYRVFMPKA